MGEPQTPLSPRLTAWERFLGTTASPQEAARQWTSFADRMRFAIGASTHDRTVPFAVATDVSRVAGRAIVDLAALVHARADALGADVSHMELRERSFGLRSFREGSLERRAARLVLGSDPWLDGTLLEAWLFRGGAGGALLAHLRSVYFRALTEELRQRGKEPTAFAAHLAIQSHLIAARESIKRLDAKGVGYEPLERAVGVGLAGVVWVAIEDAIAELKDRGLDLSRTPLWLSLASSPLYLIAIRQAVLKASPNPFGLPREMAEAVDALGVDPLGREPMAAKVSALAAKIRADATARALATEVLAINELRVSTLAYLRDFDVGHEPRNEALLAAVLSPGTLSAAKGLDAGARAAADLAGSADGIRRSRLEALLGQFDLAAKKRTIASPESQQRIIAQHWLSWRLDRFGAETLDAARAHLVDRGREFTVAELKTNWDAGKIYRLASDDQAILNVRQVREDAHLFLDLKGFTRMVATTKELSTAEFLKQSFYVPILQKALAYREAGRRLELNNLLGDAVSFSGDVMTMVYLAEDVRDLFSRYEEKLGARGASSRIEAGLFIAHGAQSEVILIDSAGWGDAGVTELSGKATRVKVAISEKINESARGTARNGTIWQRLQNLLQGRRAIDGDAELPWSVYVDRILQLSLPPAAMALCELAATRRNPAMAGEAARKVAEILQTALVEPEDKNGVLNHITDIYNVGRALSREALDAFLLETSSLRWSTEKEMAVAELPEEFARFVFQEEKLKLVVSYDLGKTARRPLVFRYAGELAFRGFEGLRSTAIYEIVDPGSRIYQALDRHFLQRWKPAVEVVVG